MRAEKKEETAATSKPNHMQTNEMTPLDHLDKALEVNKAVKGFETEFNRKNEFDLRNGGKGNASDSGTVQELQKPFALHYKSSVEIDNKTVDDEWWVVDGYEYYREDIFSDQYYKRKFDDENNYYFVVGTIRLLEVLKNEMGSNNQAKGFTMKKEAGMIRFSFDLNSFPKAKETVEKSAKADLGDVEIKAFQLDVYIDETSYALKKIVNRSNMDLKRDNVVLKQELTLEIKREFAGTIQAPEHIKKSAIPK